MNAIGFCYKKMNLITILDSFLSNRKSSLGDYTSSRIIVSSVLATFTLGLFLLLIFNTLKVFTSIKSNVKIQVYLNNDLEDEETIILGDLLSGKNFVLHVDDRPQIVFLSKEEAAKSFFAQTGSDFIKLLGENPLRGSYIISVDKHYFDRDALKLIKTDLEQINGVFEVDYVEDFIDSVNRNLTTLGGLLFLLVVILFFIIALTISNSIKLSMYSQRFIIRSMELVGATMGFIKAPFLYRAIMIAILSSNIVGVILFFGLIYIAKYVDAYVIFQSPQVMLMLISVLYCTSILVLFFSTNSSLNRYLKISLDDLH